MFQPVSAFSGFSVVDQEATVKFYHELLGLTVDATEMGATIHLPGGQTVFAYPKSDHQPADFTILNFVVDAIDTAVDELTQRGIIFEHYFDWQDEKQIARGIANHRGPDIAWFKDPSGNVLSVLQQA